MSCGTRKDAESNCPEVAESIDQNRAKEMYALNLQTTDDNAEENIRNNAETLIITLILIITIIITTIETLGMINNEILAFLFSLGQ